jgi:hypothetical protein
MKQIIIILLALLTFSCQTEPTAPLGVIEVEGNGTRGLKAESLINIKFSNQESAEDGTAVKNIKSQLFAAQKTKMLKANFSCSTAAVTDGMFVFSLDSPEHQTFKMEIFDEEGFKLGENNVGIHQGDNYKALNVQSLSEGTYIMVLADSEGGELRHEFEVK